jgi:putative DNA methylase
MTYPVKAPKKLIEVALPLDAINEACAREKSIRHGHPSTLHLWWARRPLAAARAVIFSQMVNDPSWKWEMEHPGELPPSHLKASWAASRKRLFERMKELVLWESTTNERVLKDAQAEIWKSWRETCELNKDHPDATELFNPDKLPGLHDPFAGGGAIPLEAQRLGLEAFASDLNPVAVLINKAMIEIPPKFAGQPPVNKGWQKKKPEEKVINYRGAHGLAEDVRYYGKWMRDEAQKRIGYLYPSVEITPEMIAERPDLGMYKGKSLTVIAWIWARTVKSPNPAFADVDVPLASTFMLSTKPGKEAYVEPVIENGGYRFVVRVGKPEDVAGVKAGTKLARGANFQCVMSKTPIASDHIYCEAKAGRMSARLMAIVAEGDRGRVYLAPTSAHEIIASKAISEWRPEVAMPQNPRWFSPPLYGLTTFGDLFTPRQLVALTTFSDLVGEARSRIEKDAVAAGLADDGIGLADGGTGARAYAEAVSVYLAFAVNKVADRNSSICGWDVSRDSLRNTFGRQAIPMVWDFAEGNPVETSAGSFSNAIDQSIRCLDNITPRACPSIAQQADAQTQSLSLNKIISTDPPYYDNIGYADLSDFFYVWLRRVTNDILPEIFSTLAVPKSEELVATPYRHGSKEKAESFFLTGMTQAMNRLAVQGHPGFPLTIYYAFKQSETKDSGDTVSAGWVTFLDAVLKSGCSIVGTWPTRTELSNRMIGSGNNALASSIVLVCRTRPTNAATISRRQFQRELNAVLPEALDKMTKGSGEDLSPVAPVDLSQAIIGPGMAVFSKYAAVLEADGTPMPVTTALQLINRFLAEDDFDHDTQFCLHWFEQYGWGEGKFGEADTLARAKGTAVDGVRAAGVIAAEGGIVRLLKWAEYPSNWDPTKDSRLPVWEALHHLIRAFKQDGENAAGALLAPIADKAEAVRQLAYRLYTLCERSGWAEDARAYNEIITSWSAIEAASAKQTGSGQRSFSEYGVI